MLVEVGRARHPGGEIPEPGHVLDPGLPCARAQDARHEIETYLASVAHQIRKWPDKHPKREVEIFAEAITLREAIYRIGSAIAHGAAPPAADIDALGRIHGACVAHAKLTPFRGNFVWAWRPADGVVETILGPIALSALTLRILITGLGLLGIPVPDRM